MDKHPLIDELRATAEITGTQLSNPALNLILSDLMAYPAAGVRAALSACRRELKGRLTLEAIISRIPDGRPVADEAWSSLAWDDRVTAVITTEAAEAQGLVWSTYQSGDRSGAARAFREAYTRLVNESRSRREPVTWTISLGYELSGREVPIREAVERNRITPAQARRFLPAARHPSSEGLAELLIAAAAPKAITGGKDTVQEDRSPGWMARRLAKEIEEARQRAREGASKESEKKS